MFQTNISCLNDLQFPFYPTYIIRVRQLVVTSPAIICKHRNLKGFHCKEGKNELGPQYVKAHV